MLHVINRPGRVRPETGRRVETAIKALHYQPSLIARSLCRQSKTVGVVVADIGDPSFTKIERAVQDACRQSAYKVIVCNTDEDIATERAAVQTLFGTHVDGIILAPPFGNRRYHIEQIPQTATQALLNLTRDPALLLFLANVLLLIVGYFLSTIAGILLFAPLVAQVLSEVGLDPIHVGVIVILNLMIGLITPPVGMSLYLVSNVSGEPVENVLRETVPFFIPLLACLAIVTYVPWLSTWLPRFLR